MILFCLPAFIWNHAFDAPRRLQSSSSSTDMKCQSRLVGAEAFVCVRTSRPLSFFFVFLLLFVLQEMTQRDSDCCFDSVMSYGRTLQCGDCVAWSLRSSSSKAVQPACEVTTPSPPPPPSSASFYANDVANGVGTCH